MPKGYWIARVDVENQDGYPEYIETAKPAFEQFGAKFLVRGGKTDMAEGACRARNVVIEFKSFQDAVDCYYSEQYQKAVKVRQAVASGEIVLVEGVE